MTAGLIEQDSGCEGSVEGFDALSWDGDGRGEGEVGIGDAAAFVADEYGGGLVQRDLADAQFGSGGGGVEGDVTGLDGLKELVPIESGDGKAEERAGGGAERFGIPGGDGALQKKDAGGAEGFGGTDDGAGVAGVLQAIEGDGEGISCEEVGGGLFVDAEEREDALGGFDGGDLVERGFVDEVEAGDGVELFGGAGRGDDGADGGAGAAGFFVEMEALGDGEAIVGAGTALDGLADGFEKRVVNAEHFYRLLSIARRRLQFGWAGGIGSIAALGVVCWLGWLTKQIHAQSTVDEAREADVIVIMGAAEYRGKPSPVLKARLDHGLSLYKRDLAPRFLTTGGAGGDPVFTEGTVGRNYLISRGVPSEAIIMEDEGESTVHSTVAVAEIMARMGLESCILVSDGYHIFRAKRMLEARGLRVYGSPRAIKPETGWRDWWLCVRQAVGYSLWRLGVPI